LTNYQDKIKEKKEKKRERKEKERKKLETILKDYFYKGFDIRWRLH
jgi:hypothetical protein